MNTGIIHIRLSELNKRKEIVEGIKQRLSGIPWIFQSGDDRLFLSHAKEVIKDTAIRIDEVTNLGRRL